MLLVGGCERRTLKKVASAVNPAGERLEPRSCGVQALGDIHIRCYWLTTETWGAFRLPVAVFSRAPTDTAVLHIPGGPGDGGQTTPDSLMGWRDWYEKSGLQADLVIYSPRGTRDTPQFWLCQEYEAYSVAALAKPMPAAQEAAEATAILHRCLAKYSQRLAVSTGVAPDKALQAFSSRIQASDAAQILSSLGYSHWHLWGISYGTRVALVAGANASRTPNMPVASLILDSTYPPGNGGLHQWPALISRAMAMHRANEPEFDRHWRALYSGLQEKWQAPVFRLSNWEFNLDPCDRFNAGCMQHQQQVSFVLTADRLLAVSFYVLYDVRLLPSFYRGLETMYRSLENDLQLPNPELQLVLELFLASNFSSSFSSLAFFATECVDNGASEPRQLTAARADYPEWQTELTVLNEHDVCRLEVFDALPLTDISLPKDMPVLLLAGGRDPVTPLAWAEKLADSLDSAHLIVAPSVGHSVLFSGYCDETLIARWLAEEKEVCIRGPDSP